MTPMTCWLRPRSLPGRWALALLLALAGPAVLAQPALLDMPTRLAVDAQSNVFVLESAARRVARFDAAGLLTARFGVSGTGPGQFQSVQDIAVDPAGNVLVLDRLAKAVLRFNNAGSFIDQWQLFPVGSTTRPHSLVVDGAGRLFVSDGNAGSITTFSASGQFVQGMPVITGQPGADTPGDLALDASGNLYAADRANNRVLKFGTGGPSGNPLTWIGWIGGCTSGPMCQPVPGTTGAPSRTTGWCNDFSRCGDPRFGKGLGRFEAPIFVSAAAGGAINVSDIGNGVIQRFDPTGAYLGDLALRGRMPGEIGSDATAVGPNGDVYAVQTRIGRVSRFSASGMFIGVFGGGVELSVFPGDTSVNPLRFTTPDVKASTIGVVSIGGYSGPLSLVSTRCLPPTGPPARACASMGITPTFASPNVAVTATGGAATTLQVAVGPSAPDGLSLVVVESATAGLPAFAQVAVDVKLQRAVSVAPAASAVTLMPGDPKATVSIVVKSTNVSGSTSLSGAFVPPPAAGHLSHAFVPSGAFALTPNATVTRAVDITALPAARTGNFTLNVTATAPGAAASSPIGVKVECNCSDSGDFVLPVVLPVSAVSGLNGTSPNGRFTVTAAVSGTSTSVGVASATNPSQQLVSSVGNAGAWGFSPDSRFFLVASAGPSPHLTEVAIFDLNFQNRRVLSQQVTACPLADPTCVPPPSYCYGGPGSAANNSCTGAGGATQTSSFKLGSASWGFAPDSKSFVLADVNPLVSSSQYNLRVFNLASSAQVAPAVVSTTAPAISSFWRFSPCGDLFMHFRQAFAVPGSNDTATFHRTSGTASAAPVEQAALIVAANGTVSPGPVGARVETAFVSNGDFDVRLLNLSRSTGSPATGFASPQCQRR